MNEFSISFVIQSFNHFTEIEFAHFIRYHKLVHFKYFLVYRSNVSCMDKSPIDRIVKEIQKLQKMVNVRLHKNSCLTYFLIYYQI